MSAIKSHRKKRNLPGQFADLVQMYAPRAISSDDQYQKTLVTIDELMAEGRLTKGQSTYLETLVQLVQAYEAARHMIQTSDLGGLEILQHLMSENDMSASDLARHAWGASQHGLENPHGRAIPNC